MAFLANHASLATQEGVEETPTNYTALQGVGPSSDFNQQGSSFPYVQPSQLVADLPIPAQVVDTSMQAPTNYASYVGEAHIGQGVCPPSQLQPRSSFPYVQPSQDFRDLPTSNLDMDTLMQESSHQYSDNRTNIHPFLAESNTWMDTTVAPLCPSATPYVSSAIEASTYAAPTPRLALPVAQEASLFENVAESAELCGTRRTEEDWAKQRSTIKELYMDKNMPLPSLMKVMKDKHGFCATQKRYKEKFKAWGFEKNLTKGQSKFIARKALRRLDEGKKTEFRIRGFKVPQEKVDRGLTKPNIRGSPTGSSPSEISYRTLRRDSQSLPPQMTPSLQSRELILSPSHSRALGSPKTQPQMSSDSNTTKALALRWHGFDVEALRDLHTRAVDLAKNGDHERARMMFWEAMDGLDALLGASHHFTIDALSSFVEFCLSNGLYDEAHDRLQKSLADHQAKYGDSRRLTLLSMARLGDFYYKREQRGNSEIMLVRAKHGLESLFKDDAEVLLVHTLGIGERLAELYEEQGDFEKSEQEYLSMIGKAEALGGPYVSEALRLKHSLVHLYMTRPQYACSSVERGVPLLKLERLLIECIETCEYTSIPPQFDLCFLDILRNQYHTQGENLKLENLLIRIVHRVEAVEKSRAVFDHFNLRQIKQGLAHSFLQLGNRGAAEWWYLRLQPEIDTYYGVYSRKALELVVQIALFYLGQDQWDEAEPYFRDAQQRAEVVLEQDDPIKEKIAKCLTTRVYKSECPCCML